MIKKELGKIINQKEIAADIYELTLEAELVNEIKAPGQFFHIRVSSGQDPLLRRPISIASFDKSKFPVNHDLSKTREGDIHNGKNDGRNGA